jgi:hypothetical protein
VNYGIPSYPVEAIFESEDEITIIAPNRRIFYSVIFIVGLVGIQFLLVFLAIYFRPVRTFILHPVGLETIDQLRKINLTYPLICFVKPIKMAIFRDYRKNLQKHLKQCVNGCEPNDRNWECKLEYWLQQPTGQMWLILSESELATTLLRKWEQHALTLKKTPIFIDLKNLSPPQEEAAILMRQHGDINVTSEVAFDLLIGGGFVVLLDGFDKVHNTNEIQKFVRLISKHNHLIMTSKVDPKWDNVLQVNYINLEYLNQQILMAYSAVLRYC